MQDLDDLLSIWEQRRADGVAISPEELCADRPEVLDELRWQINALEAIDSKFGVSTGSQFCSTPSSSDDAEIPQLTELQVSTEYRIEKLHAVGGLGRVYLAHDMALNRRVALKVPRSSRVSASALARFEREARITSRLDHPGIVPVHAIGNATGSCPCYVMRFVEGRNLQEEIAAFHAKGQAVNFTGTVFRSLLRRLQTVCDIVAYAHSQRVIHRDIKPNNIMLGAFGETLLVDWGLAKVLGESPEDSRLIAALPTDSSHHKSFDTLPGQIVGTPAFASPEQLFSKTAEVCQQSDVYSLGATLFCLLTGDVPFQSAEITQHLERMKSGAVVSARSRLSTVPAALDAICRKAMSPAVGDRYASASELARDIDRYLSDEPLSIWRDNWRVRFARWVRKQPGRAAATLSGVLVAAVAIAVSSLLLGQKNSELTHINLRLADAVQESKQTTAQALESLDILVDDVLVHKFNQQAELTTADRQFLEKVRSRYEALAEMRGHSTESLAIRAGELRQTGRLHGILSDVPQAITVLQQAADLYREVLRKDAHLEHRKGLGLSLAELSIQMLNAGRLSDGEQFAREGLQLFPARPAADETIVVARLELSLGRLLAAKQLWKEARTHYSRARDQLQLSPGSRDSEYTILLAEVQRQLSYCATELLDIREFQACNEQTLALQRDLIGRHPDLTVYRLELANALYLRSFHLSRLGDMDSALQVLTEAITISEELNQRFPEVIRFQEMLAFAYQHRGHCHNSQGSQLAADQDLDRAQKILEQITKSYPDRVNTYSPLINTYRFLIEDKLWSERIKEAEDYSWQAYKLGRQYLERFPERAQSSSSLGTLYVTLAMVLRRQGHLAESTRLLEQATEMFQSQSPDDETSNSEYYTLSAMTRLAMVHKDRGDLILARQYLDKAAELASDLEQQHTGEYGFLAQVASSVNYLADAYASINCPELAEQQRQFELQIREAVAAGLPEFPVYQLHVAKFHLNRGSDLVDKRKLDEADLCFEQAATVLRRTALQFPENRSIRQTLGTVEMGFGRAEYHRRRYHAALEHWDRGVELNPTAGNRALRVCALAHISPANVPQEVENIMLIDPPVGRTFSRLADSLKLAFGKTKDPTLKETSGKLGMSLVRNYVNSGRVLRMETLKTFREQKDYTWLRSRPEFQELLDEIDAKMAAAAVASAQKVKEHLGETSTLSRGTPSLGSGDFRP